MHEFLDVSQEGFRPAGGQNVGVGARSISEDWTSLADAAGSDNRSDHEYQSVRVNGRPLTPRSGLTINV
jgi:hypothetical protein